MIRKFALLAGLSCVFAVAPANAHFLWLKSDAPGDKPQAVLIFGESAADEAYHLPEAIAGTQIWCRTLDGKRSELKTDIVETDDRVGLVGPLPDAKLPEVIEATREYGVYANMLLTYYAKHIRTASNDQLAAAGPSSALALDIVPKATDDGLELTLHWNGKPRPDADVTIKLDGENEDVEAKEFKTDADGKIKLDPQGAKLVAVLANIADKSKSGEHNGKKYAHAAHYVSLTFPWHAGDSEAQNPADGKESVGKAVPANIPPLPEAVSSFGAAVADGYLYVYGGHTGTEHDHSQANLSKHFRRIKLDGGKQWEELPMQQPLQGLALVAHGGKLYRIGGMTPRNATVDDEEDLHSTADFVVYEPKSRKWTALAKLPNPRSSHNAVVIGDTLYVTGGWTLAGSSDGEWLVDSLVYDLADPIAGWQMLPQQKFRRRALAASQWRGKLAAICGMDENAKVSRRVDVFDPVTRRWSQLPNIPGSGMTGFGAAAWNLDGELYVSGFNGRVYRLDTNGAKWTSVARLAKPRFFHQMLPAGDESALLVVAGAARDGHLADIERVEVLSEAARYAADRQAALSASR